MMDQEGQYYGRSANSSHSAAASDLYWFQHQRLGRDFQRSREEGRLVTNVLKLLAIWKVLQCFVHDLERSVVMVVYDNMTTIAYICKQGGTRSRSLMQVTQNLFNSLEENRITLGVGIYLAV